MLFWMISFSLVLIAYIFVLPTISVTTISANNILTKAISGKYQKLIILFLLIFSVFSLYLIWGESHHLGAFYSEKSKKIRTQQEKIRPIFSELKKQQGRHRLTLLENPNDDLAKALLLELMGVEALHREDQKLALRFWEAALQLLPKSAETETVRSRITGLKEHVAKVAF